MSEALINPKILSWARMRINLSSEDLAKKLNVKETQIEAWENGKKRPTFIQAQKLAEKLHIPFGYLYLKEIPQEKLSIPDLRTIKDLHKSEISSDMYDLLNDLRFKQDWYRDYLIEQGREPLFFAGKYSIDTNYKTIAEDITNTLKLDMKHRESVSNWEDFLKLLIDKSEEVGIWVMRSGIVGNNTHRPLKVQEFRGLVIYDEIVPIVFLNGKDAKAAQIFTLIHELAHIWIGESGVSDLSLDVKSNILHNKIEKLCNKVTAEVLVPEIELKERWRKEIDYVEQIEQLTSFFKVSSIVVARRAYDLNLIEWQEYNKFYQNQQELWKKIEKRGSGGQTKYTIPMRYGKHFTNIILMSALNGKIMLRDAGRLLGLAPPKLFNLAKDLGVV